MTKLVVSQQDNSGVIDRQLMTRLAEEGNVERLRIMSDEFIKQGGDVGSIPELVALFQRNFDASITQSGLEANSLRAFKSALALFQTYCDEMDLPWLPATTGTVKNYLAYRGQHVKKTTLGRDRWMISLAHQWAGAPDPTASIEIRKLLKNIAIQRRTEESVGAVGVRNKQVFDADQASPFREIYLDALHDLWHESSHIYTLRNLTLLTVAYETLLRESELVRIKIPHITSEVEHNDAGELVEHWKLVIYETKKKKGEMDFAPLSPRCVNLIEAYLSLSGRSLDDRGFLFVRHKRPTLETQAKSVGVDATGAEVFEQLAQRPHIHADYVDEIFKKGWLALFNDPKKVTDENADTVIHRQNLPVGALAGKIRRPPEPWSGHSSRVGACQDLLAAGETVADVQMAGRWADAGMITYYGRGILQQHNAMGRRRANKV
ncbi:tyrosine-type recombinase/integrase [Motilimonas cestriensis]|uniref:Tyrosine-type recombinase/integrase n=1 Tax=Motilimonas cestriensis TaxID=2742685 RepID=A0ABS8WDL3_9GAMM|nr:tyrosine-type recombinase/integrase [Motilimonas cestriensis]MCE2597136.1 tyrosine-type recombinase/integrase [Motilimonas cestriensis]